MSTLASFTLLQFGYHGTSLNTTVQFAVIDDDTDETDEAVENTAHTALPLVPLSAPFEPPPVPPPLFPSGEHGEQAVVALPQQVPKRDGTKKYLKQMLQKGRRIME